MDAVTIIQSDDPEADQKSAFALALLHHKNPFSAALAVMADDTGKALQIANQWKDDPFVKSEMERLIVEFGPRVALPAKEEFANKILNAADELDLDGRRKIVFEDRLKAYRLVAEILGYIEKPAQTTNINNTVQSNRVMIVKDHGNADDWEKRLKTQQKNLIDDASGGGESVH